VRYLLLGARWSYIGLALSIATISLALRALRFRALLEVKGSVSTASVFWATAAASLGNNVLPARAGEVVRTWMMSSGGQLSGAFILVTALSERIVDAIVLIAIGATVVLIVPGQPGWLEKATSSFVIAGFIGVVAIAILPRMESFGRNLARRIRCSPSLRKRTERVLESCLLAVRSFHDPRRLLRFLGATALIWALDAGGSMVCANAIGLQLRLGTAFILLAGLGLGSALPSAPAYAGIYQFVAVSVLVPAGFTRSDAIAYILLLQALSYLVTGLWGGIGLARYHRMTVLADAVV
jgi:hypothetical protein